jgi:hypothetical protein
LGVLALGLLSSYLLKTFTPKEKVNGSWACTADAMICPDGTGVGRVPPYCHFAPCP